MLSDYNPSNSSRTKPGAGAGETAVNAGRGGHIEWSDHKDIFTSHDFPEHIVDLGEVRMNYAVAGSSSNPPILLIPGQTESWWTYEPVIHLLAHAYQVYAVDLRGQGRSTWTPGRYSIDLFGGDLVRFIDRVIGRPVIVSGLSSGGVITAWLSAYASPGQVLAAVYEDPPLFASEANPAVGQGVRDTFVAHIFRTWTNHLGPQWSIGDEEGMKMAMYRDMPPWLKESFAASKASTISVHPPTNLHEYDPEWAESFLSGRASAACSHETMLKHVKVPVLFTHHNRYIHPGTGNMLGAISDQQANYVQQLVEAAGNSFTYRSFPDQPHAMHRHDPALFVTTVTNWLAQRGLGKALNPGPSELASKYTGE